MINRSYLEIIDNILVNLIYSKKLSDKSSILQVINDIIYEVIEDLEYQEVVDNMEDYVDNMFNEEGPCLKGPDMLNDVTFNSFHRTGDQ